MKKFSIILAMLMVLPSVAVADYNSTSSNEEPPARYVHRYVRGKLYVGTTAAKDVAAACYWLFKDPVWGSWGALRDGSWGPDQTGCATWYLDERGPKYSWCKIIIPNNDDGSSYRHEIAHCNGWAADHPNK